MDDQTEPRYRKRPSIVSQRQLAVLGALTVASIFVGGGCSSGGSGPLAGTGGSLGVAGSGGATSAGGSLVAAGGMAVAISCPAGQSACGSECVDANSDVMNCGACGVACTTGQVCGGAAGCQCQPGLLPCGDTCFDPQSDGLNCGACGNICPIGEVCSMGACKAACDTNLAQCRKSCVALETNVAHCGTCDNACAAGRGCADSACGCEAGQTDCSGACVDTQTSGSHCGACGVTCGGGEVCSAGMCICPAGQTCAPPATGGVGNTGGQSGTGSMPSIGGGPSNVGGGPSTGGGTQVIVVEGRTCPAYEGLIADFEEATEPTVTLAAEGREGLIVGNNDGSATQTVTIETEGTEDCNNKVLHTSGSGFDVWGAGLETVFTGTWDAAENGYVASPYDAAALGYVGVSFRAKAGPGQANPVRFSLSVPGTRKPDDESEEGKNGNCVDNDPDSACWNHLGQFLSDNEELTSDWQDYTFCFDRDLHARFMPVHLSPAQRADVGKELMTLGFEFNKGTEENGDENDIGQSFDFYVDDIRLVRGGCDRPIFQSTDGATQPFGSNLAVGSCQPVPNAAAYNAQIGDAYVRWRDSFVDGSGAVVDRDNGNKIISEGIGYGMLLAAAMGDKPTFDKIWGWASGRLAGNGLLGWDNGDAGSGSATDADTDIAYALYMADHQWGGYSDAANAMAQSAAGADLNGTTIKGGSQFDNSNPSYFSPGFYRKLGGSWSGVISAGYSWLDACDGNFGGGQNGLIPDWCSPGGNPETPGGQVTSDTCEAGQICSAYDASRIPWRVGYDVCFDGAGAGLATRIVNKFNTFYGGRIDLLEAGWDASGNPTSGAVPNEMAFLGTVGVAAWATDDENNRDRTLRATLDLLELREYYKKYYSTSLGLLTLTMMTGNWPVP